MRKVIHTSLIVLAVFLFSACESGPAEPELFQKATLAQEQSDFPTAIKAYEELVQRFPKSSNAPKCQFMIGYLYANHLKQPDKARGAYQAFIKAYPEHLLVKDAQWELDHLGMDVNQIDELNKVIGTQDTTKGSKSAG